MTIETGDQIPSVKLRAVTPDAIRDVTTDELFAGKRVVLFGVPGAFTPTCSARHLPGFVEHAAAIRAKGVDEVVCLAVNDPFVLQAWAKDRQVGEAVLLLSDGNGELTRALGLELDGTALGMGHRSKRYALVARNGVAEDVAVEEPMKFEVSSAEAVLARL